MQLPWTHAHEGPGRLRTWDLHAAAVVHAAGLQEVGRDVGHVAQRGPGVAVDARCLLVLVVVMMVVRGVGAALERVEVVHHL